MRNGMKQFYQSYFENTKLSPMVREKGRTKKSKINKSKYVNNELKRKRTNSNCMSSFQFVSVRCLNYSINRTRMTRIARIFTDTFYPCVSVSSAQSVFHPKNPDKHDSAFFSVHKELKELNNSPQCTQRAQSIATIFFAYFALFAVRLTKILYKLSNIAVPSAFIGFHPRLIHRTAPAEGR